MQIRQRLLSDLCQSKPNPAPSPVWGALSHGEGGARGLHAHDLGIAQENTVQRRALINHLLQMMGGHPQTVPGELDEELQWRCANAEGNGNADHALSPDQADLDLVALAVGGDRGVAALMEVDVLDGFIRLDQHTAQFKLDRLQMRLKAREVLSREPREKLVAKG